MSKEEKTTAAAAAGALALIVLVAGLSLGWSAWTWAPIAALPVIGAAALVHQVGVRRDQRAKQREYVRKERPEPEPEPPRREPFADVSVRSAVPDYWFLLSGTAFWLPNPRVADGGHWNPGAVAKDAVVSRAAEVLRQAQPDEHSALTERLNAVLGVAIVDPSGNVQAWGGDLQVALADSDQKRLHRLADVRKEVEVWEHERNHERNVREYLGADVLSSPGSAVVWWLARHLEDQDSGLHAAVENIGPLRQLTFAAHQAGTPEWPNADSAWSAPVAGYHFAPALDSAYAVNGGSETGRSRGQRLVDLLVETTADHEQDERDLFVEQQARLLEAHGCRQEAAMLRERFDLARLPSDEAEQALDERPSTAVADERDEPACGAAERGDGP